MFLFLLFSVRCVLRTDRVLGNFALSSPVQSSSIVSFPQDGCTGCAVGSYRFLVPALTKTVRTRKTGVCVRFLLCFSLISRPADVSGFLCEMVRVDCGSTNRN